MTVAWTTQISEAKWRRTRRELENNQLIMPFHSGVAQNRKTGYTFSNKYDRDSSRLELRITYPGDVNLRDVSVFMEQLFDSPWTISR